MSKVTVPPQFSKFVSLSGSFRKYIKVIAYGPGKVGKSRLLGGMPKPIFAIDAGEGGIQQYLSEDAGDVCMTITDPMTAAEAWEWACAQAKEKRAFESLALDSGSIFWENVKDVGTGGRERVEVQEWGKIKKPSDRVLKAGMSVPANVGISAWVKELSVEQGAALPGINAKLQVKKVQLARLEFKYAYLFDLLYYLDQEEDKLGRQTGCYTLEFIGGRVPEAVPAEQLFSGRTWVFDPKKDGKKSPQEVYEEVVGWLRPFKEKGGVETLVGVELEDLARAWDELATSVADEAMGRIVRMLGEMKSAADYHAASQKLMMAALGLKPEQKTVVNEWTARRKAESGYL